MKTVQAVNCFTARQVTIMTSKPMEPEQAADLLEQCESRPCRSCRQLRFYKRAVLILSCILAGHWLAHIVGWLQ